MKPLFFYRIKENLSHTGASWDELAPDEDVAIEYAHKHINEDPDIKDSNGKYSLEYCLASSAESINERLRADSPEDIDIKISERLSGYTTDTDLVLYRGVCEYVYEKMISNANAKKCDLYEKGFLCTSLLKGHEYDYKTKLRIYVPRNSHVIYQGNITGEQNNYEVDIQCGSRLKIISVDHDYINTLLLSTR